MPSIDEWKYLKSRYENLQYNVKCVLSALDNCKTLISNANKHCSKVVIDGDSSIDNGQITKIGDSVSDMTSKLINTVLPALSSKISEIRSEIAKAESEGAE